MLNIKNLQTSVENKHILQGLNLNICSGEVHAIMGPNGAGKSTLGNILAGKDGYETSADELTFLDSGLRRNDGNVDLLTMEPEDRAAAGLFLAFQHPMELPGVNAAQFLRASVNAVRSANGEAELNAAQFLKQVRALLPTFKLDNSFLKRGVNEGFSGGEKKRFDMLHMALLEPKLCILDETDSGLDVDALKAVGEGVNALREAGRSFVIITHYQRLLGYIKPDHVHVIINGKIVQSGGIELAAEIEKSGYTKWI